MLFCSIPPLFQAKVMSKNSWLLSLGIHYYFKLYIDEGGYPNFSIPLKNFLANCLPSVKFGSVLCLTYNACMHCVNLILCYSILNTLCCNQ